MATRLQDAKIRVSLEVDDAIRQLDDISARQTAATRNQETLDDNLKKDEDRQQTQDAQTRARFRPRDLLDPLNFTLNAITAVPVVGAPFAGAARTALDVAEFGAPILAGLSAAVARSAGAPEAI